MRYNTAGIAKFVFKSLYLFDIKLLIMCGVTLTQNHYTSVRLSRVFPQGLKAIIR